MRVCSEEYLKEECEHITESFRSLKYPRAFIVECHNKTRRIKARASTETEEKPNAHIVVVPKSQHSEAISRAVRRSGIRVVEKSGEKVGQIVMLKKPKNQRDSSLAYNIPCNGCSLPYYGETSRGLKQRS